MVFAISIVAVLAFLIIPLLLSARPAMGHGPSAMSLLYFISIGLGFILAEIAFIQRFVLFLGHPTYALTVVIFMMLLASGAGSLASRRWLTTPSRVWVPLVAIIVILAAYVFV